MKTIFFLQLLLISLFAKAQDPAFVVYYAKGNVAKQKTVLKKGDKLFANDAISLQDQSNVILVCKNYRVIKIAKKGNYTVNQLMNQCSDNASSFTASYFSYVWNEFVHPHHEVEEEPGKYMKNVGAVSRGCPGIDMILPVDTINYATGVLPIYFTTSISSPQLVVYDAKQDGKLLWQQSLKDKPIQIEKVAQQLKRPGTYYWQIKAKDNPSECEHNVLIVWRPDEYKKLVDKLMAGIIATTPAETAYMKGFIMEENGFLAEALKYYTQASQLDKKNSVYKQTMERFSK